MPPFGILIESQIVWSCPNIFELFKYLIQLDMYFKLRTVTELIIHILQVLHFESTQF